MTMTNKDVEEGRAKGPGGPPRRFKSPEEMQTGIDKYFSTDGKKTVSGLALFLGFNDHRGLWEYSEYYGREFADVIARARAQIREYYESLGQEVRSGHFPDRMLTRMKWPCEESPGLLGAGSGTTVLVFTQDAGQALPAAARKAIESTVSDPGDPGIASDDDQGADQGDGEASEAIEEP